MATKSTSQTDKAPAKTGKKEFEILTEKRLKRDRHGEKWGVEIPTGKYVPVVLITTPLAFNAAHENELRKALNGVCKRHDHDGKLYFEVGESDDVIEARINDAIDVLRGMGITGERSVEYTSYLHRREW